MFHSWWLTVTGSSYNGRYGPETSEQIDWAHTFADETDALPPISGAS